MSHEIKKMLRCNKCGEDFEVDVYDSINVTLNPELKQKVMDGSIYEFVCPFCGEEHYIQYPFLYNDMEHNFMIQSGSFIELMEYYEDVVKNKRNNLNDHFSRLLDDVTELGVDSYRELLSKITMLEHGLDYRIGTLYCLFIEHKYQKIIELDNKLKEQGAFVCDSFFIEYEGKPAVVVDIDLNDDKHTHKTPGDEFNQELYDAIFSRYNEKVNEVFNYCFNRDVAYKFMSIAAKEVESYKEAIMEVAVVEYDDGNHVLTFVPEFNEGKYENDDFVCIMKKHCICKGKIVRIFHMNRYALPYDLDDMPVVAYKTNDIELTTTAESNYELENSKLREMLLNFQNGKELDDVMLSNSNVLIGSITTMDMANWLKPGNDAELMSLIPDDEGNVQIPISSMQTKLLKYEVEDQDAKLLCIYLGQKELTNTDASRYIYNFDDVVNVVLNNPDRYDGIIINPESDKIMIPNSRLVLYKQYKIMTDSKRMRELLPKLKPEEISYMGKFNYEVIKKVYFEKKGPQKIADELGKALEEVDEALDNGYWCLKHIIWDNYSF